MTREETKQLLPIITAFSEGKTIQYNAGGVWEDINAKDVRFNAFPSYYRIKPEPTYRPFANEEECWNEMLKHQPFGWIKAKDKTVPSKYILLGAIRGKGAVICATDFAFSEMLQYYTFADGSAFGIKEED